MVCCLHTFLSLLYHSMHQPWTLASSRHLIHLKFRLASLVHNHCDKCCWLRWKDHQFLLSNLHQTVSSHITLDLTHPTLHSLSILFPSSILRHRHDQTTQQYSILVLSWIHWKRSIHAVIQVSRVGRDGGCREANVIHVSDWDSCWLICKCIWVR